MAILIKCRHCEESIGTVDDPIKVYETMKQNGFTQEEMNEMIHYDETGQVELQLICEHCEELLAQNPNLFENDNFIH